MGTWHFYLTENHQIADAIHSALITISATWYGLTINNVEVTMNIDYILSTKKDLE